MNFKSSLLSLISVCSLSIMSMSNEKMTEKLFRLVQTCEQHLASTQATEKLLFEIDDCLEHNACQVNQEGHTIRTILEQKRAALDANDPQFADHKELYFLIEGALEINAEFKRIRSSAHSALVLRLFNSAKSTKENSAPWK